MQLSILHRATRILISHEFVRILYVIQTRLMYIISNAIKIIINNHDTFCYWLLNNYILMYQFDESINNALIVIVSRKQG